MNLFELFVTLTIDSGSYIRGVNEAKEKNKSLGDSAKQLGTAAETLQNKIKVLDARYSAANKRVEELSEALNRSVRETGAESKEAQELAQQLKQAERQADELSKEINNLSEASDDAGDSTASLAERIKSNFAGIAKAVAGIGAAVTAIGKIGSALYEVTEETREYRTEMGKLETAFTSSGHSATAAKETYQELYSVLGETDRSVEASQQLAKLCDSEQQLQDWTTILIGAFAAFDDSLPIEGLAEAANETAKTGTLVGVLVDAINWAGASEEEFQKQLDACTTEQERQAVITQKLTSLYGKTAEAYKKNNKDVIDAAKAQEKLTAATARLGEIAEPMVTVVKEGLAGAVNFLADSVTYLLDPMGYVIEKMEGTAKTSQEAAEKIADYENQLAELAKIPPILWSEEHAQQQAYLTTALEEAKGQYEELRAAEQNMAETSADAAEQAAADSAAIMEEYIKTFEAIFDRLYDAASVFTGIKEATKTSADEIRDNLSGNTEFYTEMGDNLNYVRDSADAAEINIDSMMQILSNMDTEAAAGAIAAIREEIAALEGDTEGQAEIFAKWNEDLQMYAEATGSVSTIFAEVVSGIESVSTTVTTTQEGIAQITESVVTTQDELVQTVILNNENLITELTSLKDNWEAIIAEMDKSKEAKIAAESTLQAFIDGMNNKIPTLLNTMESIGNQITSALQRGIGSVSIPVTVETSGTIPGHKSGLDFVPYDDYLAYLHKGEAVLTAEEAAAWRAGKSADGGEQSSGGDVTIIQNIETVPQTPVEFASTTAAYFEQARWIT